MFEKRDKTLKIIQWNETYDKLQSLPEHSHRVIYKISSLALSRIEKKLRAGFCGKLQRRVARLRRWRF